MLFNHNKYKGFCKSFYITPSLFQGFRWWGVGKKLVGCRQKIGNSLTPTHLPSFFLLVFFFVLAVYKLTPSPPFECLEQATCASPHAFLIPYVYTESHSIMHRLSLVPRRGRVYIGMQPLVDESLATLKSTVNFCISDFV